MTTPTTPAQARHAAQNMDFDVGVSDVPGMLLSLAQQVEELTAERDDYRMKYNDTYGALDDCAREHANITAERDTLKPDAERYQKLRARTKAQRGSSFDQMWFILPDVKRMPDQNIMKGSVAQHLDTAIDAMEAAA